MRWTGLLCVAMCAVMLLVTGAVADSQYVDRCDYVSKSGQWKARVEPSNAEGKGKARYSVSNGGVVVWSADLDVTLRDCVVSDSGTIAGYAYDTGYVGWGGNLVVLIVSPTGQILAQDARTRDGPALHIDPPPPGEPRGNAVLLDEEGQRVIVSTTKNRFEEDSVTWLVYGLGDGKLIESRNPKCGEPGQFRFVREISSLAIHGTGLTATHWYGYQHKGGSAVFQIADRSEKLVWSRTIDDEYSAMPKNWAWWDLIKDGVRQLEVGEGTFSIVSYSEGKRTQYLLKEVKGGTWEVSEAGKSGVVLADNKVSKQGLQTTPGTMESVGEVVLDAPKDSEVIGGLCMLSFNDKGHMGWVRWVKGSSDGSSRFTLVSREGATIADFALPLTPSKHAPLATATWLSGDTWLIARTEYVDNTGKGVAFFLDVPTKNLTPVANLKCGSIDQVCRTADGGFIVLASLFGDYTIRDQLMRFDPKGEVISTKTGAGYGHGDNYKDVAVLTDGTIATLEMVPNVIKLWRPNAADPEVWQVEDKLAGTEAGDQRYVASIRADRDGGMVLYDSANNNLLHRLDRTGKPWQSIHARGPKDEPFRLYDPFAVDPDGRVWVSDGNRLFRCSDSGQADIALGGPPAGTMNNPVALTLDAKGRIYAVEDGTAWVHVFDESGKPLQVMKPEPGTMPTQDALSWIVVEDDGSVRYRMTWEGPIITFDSDGRQVSVEKPKDSWEVAEIPWRKIGQGWEENGSEIRRLDAEGKVLTSLRHRPDGAWLVTVGSAAAASDGSLAVVCKRPEGMGWNFGEGPAWLCVYGPQGEDRGTLAIGTTSPFQRVRYDGTRVLLCDENGVTALKAPLSNASVATRFTMDGPEDSFWQIRLRADGKVASWSTGTRAIQFWRLPD